MKTMRQAILTAVAVLSLAIAANGQSGNPFPITGVASTVEGAIKLSWQSETNTVYEVQYADQLVDASLGGTVFLPLYSDYPSHGTNTFWLDTGDYNSTPPILHPSKSPARFYRVVSIGTNTAPAPTVSITAPSNNATVSGNLTVTVNASSSQIVARTLLFVDGQEMPRSLNNTNFVINTCEWPNGPHTLFAVVKSQSAFEGIPNDGSVLYGRAVSPYVNLTFNNLITRYSWSEPYFEPALGQTQQVRAVFAANVNWVLEIQDVNTNDVLYVTGSGGSMQYDWNGTGTNGVSIPDGIYTYLLTAQTNGLALPQSDPQTNDNTNGPPSMQMNSAAPTDSDWYPTSAAEAAMAGWDHFLVESPPMPPVETNGVSVPWEEVYGPMPLIEVPIDNSIETVNPTDSSSVEGVGADYAGASSQSTRGPVRPANNPGKGTIGTFGVGYQTYYFFPGFFGTPPIRTGWPFPVQPQYVDLDGSPGGITETWYPVRENADMAQDFISAMKAHRFKLQVVKRNDSLTVSDVLAEPYGGTNTFNQVNIGFLSLHCSYGDTAEIDGIRHTYLRFYNTVATTPSYAKVDQCRFGTAGTNGLKYMAILACSVLRTNNFNDMYSNGVLPINNDLHLLLSSSSVVTAAPDIGTYWGNLLFTPGETVEQAWFHAGSTAYTAETNDLIITFRVAGWPDAFAETVANMNSSPGTGNPLDIQYDDFKVFSLP